MARHERKQKTMPVRTKKALTSKGVHMMMAAAVDTANRLNIAITIAIITKNTNPHA